METVVVVIVRIEGDMEPRTPDTGHGNHRLWYREQTPTKSRLKERVL